MASKSQATGGDGAAASTAEGPARASAVVGAVAEGAVAGACNVKKPQNVPPALDEKPAGLPPGKYKLVGLDLESTGRRLTDEIIKIAAHTPFENNFSQYIMPYRDLKQGVRRRHKVRVVSVGRFRMLKDTVMQQVIKSKSEVSALNDFLHWLETIKTEKEMIVFIYHDPSRLIPTLLIQSCIRHRLFDRFKTLVAGFADSYAICAVKCKDIYKSASLVVLTRLMLDQDVFSCETALDRAIAIYNIIEQLAHQDDYLDVGNGDEAAAFTGPSESMLQLACEFARPIYTEVEAFEALKNLLERQNTFRSAFDPIERAPRAERLRLTQLRRHLADAGLLYEQVKDAWHEGRRAGLKNLFTPLEQTLSAEDIQQLVDLFEKHFSPDLAPVVMESRSNFTDDSDGRYLSSDSDDDLLSSTTSGLGSVHYVVEEEVDLYLDF